MTQDEKWLLTEKYHGVETPDFLNDCVRLQKGEPLAYVIGHIPFLNTTISLAESHPLIPRPETEYWVSQILPKLAQQKPDISILDLCAGSGCIGVAALAELPLAHVDFVEIEGRHHTTIEKNVRMNGIDMSRVHIYGGDLFANVTAQYDAILSNPPYIDPVLDRTEESVRTYEPHIALYGGTAGLELIRRIIERSPQHLTKDGILTIEHEPEQCDQIFAWGTKAGFSPAHHKDQYGTYRYTVFTRGSSESMAP